MSRPKVIIIDYGMGNLFSIERAIRHLDGEAIISSDLKTIETAERLIIPGVGAYSEAMKNLKQRGLVESIQKFVATGRPLLGICLGMQLLMSESEEFGLNQGLNLIPGRVTKFNDVDQKAEKIKVPNVSWCRLSYPTQCDVSAWQGTILEKLPEKVFMYFVHSYFAVPTDKKNILAESHYGQDIFCSVVYNNNNIYGCQFHPEKSGKAGLSIYRKFLYDL